MILLIYWIIVSNKKCYSHKWNNWQSPKKHISVTWLVSMWFYDFGDVVDQNTYYLMVMCFLVRQTKKRWDIPTSIFLVNLAYSDGAIEFMSPISVTVGIVKIEDGWSVSIRRTRGLNISMFLISLFSLLAIALDKYNAVVRGLSNWHRMSIKWAKMRYVVNRIGQFIRIIPLTYFYGSNELDSIILCLIIPRIVLLFLLNEIILYTFIGWYY